MAIYGVGEGILGLSLSLGNPCTKRKYQCYSRVNRCDCRSRERKRNAASEKLVALVAVAVTLQAAAASPLPCSAIPNLQDSLYPPAATPFSQSKNLTTGLLNGKIRPCPSVNPGCVSTNPKSSSFAFPWRIPQSSSSSSSSLDVNDVVRDAILKTQRNAKIQVVEDTPYGKYLKAEVDGGLGRDVLEFLIKGDVVAYRVMATQVTYVYPFTTAFGDSKGQEERMKKIVEELGWYSPSFDSMD
ncbi:PREDICTED: thylakoid lumenal 17.9 kDa protein, chloroplastic isoform X2 [Ipomoea nil]|uniref:thylakoid lumenal 17.9 kDa protein, chloroplastic isoform X2 n=1 Tax=Ipomoea nil TaxID=35883 RepID=UPI00090165DF|nr:PREDICTED: thylakoid lumenal 17.9 kDa protein, chloroplastic isoform X2 [Ipomoea nil]